MPTNNETLYVPILKGKRGELSALERLAPATQKGIFPLVDVPRPKPKASPEVALERAITTIARNWHHPLFFDLFDFDLSIRTSAGLHPMRVAMEQLASRNRVAIPVTGFDRDDTYWHAAVAGARGHQLGLCIRLQADDIEEPTSTVHAIRSRLHSHRFTAEEVDVLLDLRSLADKDIGYFQAATLDAIKVLAAEFPFRRIIFAASSMPRSITEVKHNSTGFIGREELGMWRFLLSATSRAPSVVLGDYGVVHPDFVDPIASPNVNAKIRYATEAGWLVFRGQSLTKPPKYQQYHALARRVVEHSDYRGVAFSWGDNYIHSCAHERCSSGSLTTWVTVDTNHHIELTLQSVRSVVGAPAASLASSSS
jgi:hypothetical protein